MDFSATHIGFVIAAYALTAAVVGGLILAILMTDRARARELDRRKQAGLPHDH
ncbi:MAG TPA: heme exporter protein CcmD [Aestuariivirga sp.]|nr:heme exporter protein CcmD [Aestuariivirga sp.]